MGQVGRPMIPTEIKRKRGTLRPHRLPNPANVVLLRQAGDVPPCPADLGPAGRQLWERAWDAAITWLSPASDACHLAEVCRLADDLVVARDQYRATTDPTNAHAVVALSKLFISGLSALGFTPVARARLGVAEVRRASALEELAARRQRR
jgi:hypothetical protein